MITLIDNSSDNAASNAGNSDSMSIINLNTCINFINDNSYDYSLFNMNLVFNYINNQLIYYFIFDAISVTEQVYFQQLMKQCKTFLELLK